MQINRAGAALLTLVVLAASACKSGDKANPDVLAQDSSLTRDLQLANRDTTAQPQLRDVPTTPPPAPPRQVAAAPVRRPAPPPVVRRTTPAPARSQPVATASAPVSKAPAPVVTASGNTIETGPAATGRTEGTVGVVAAGTSLALNAGQRICTNTNSVGDRITATLTDAVTGSNGVVIPAGATAVLEVTSLGRSEQAGENMNIGLVVKSVSYGGRTYPVNGEITYAQVEQVKGADNNDAAKVLGGAAIGAILGRVIGGGRSRTRGTIIGAAGGAAAGAVLAHQTANYDACIPSGGRVTVRLDSPMSVQAGSATGTI